MRSKHISLVTSILLCALLSATASAGVFVPDGLEVGDEYRLLFVTSESVPVFDRDLVEFDAFVKSEADMAGSLVVGLEWDAIVSVTGTSAASRALIDDIPVYGTTGELLATDYAGLFSMFSSSTTATREFNQFGETEGSALVWSGSMDTGEEYMPLGQSYNSEGGWGVAGTTYDNWLHAEVKRVEFYQSSSMRLYGISDVIRAVPEPATIVLWLVAGLIGLGWSRRRKS